MSVRATPALLKNIQVHRSYKAVGAGLAALFGAQKEVLGCLAVQIVLLDSIWNIEWSLLVRCL